MIALRARNACRTAHARGRRDLAARATAALVARDYRRALALAGAACRWSDRDDARVVPAVDAAFAAHGATVPAAGSYRVPVDCPMPPTVTTRRPVSVLARAAVAAVAWIAARSSGSGRHATR